MLEIRPNGQRLIQDVRGNVAILFGMAIIPLALGVGVAVDYGRSLLVRERMQSALDAATLQLLARGLALVAMPRCRRRRSNISTRTIPSLILRLALYPLCIYRPAATRS